MAVAAFVAARLGASRGGIVVDRSALLRSESGIDPRTLEHLAEEAEGRGELEAALRLRFRAGLLRLARVEAVRQPETLTSRQLVRLLGAEQFGRLASDLDEVVYGGRAASRADVEIRTHGLAAGARTGGRTVRKRVVIGLVAIIVGLNVASRAVELAYPGRSGSPSSAYATSEGGLAAFAELVRRDGHAVARLREPPHELDLSPARTTLVLADAGIVEDADANRSAPFRRARRPAARRWAGVRLAAPPGRARSCLG